MDFEEDAAWLARSQPVTDSQLGECLAPVFSKLEDGVFTMTDCPAENSPEYKLEPGSRQPYREPIKLDAKVETVRGFCQHPTLGPIHDMHHRLNGLEVLWLSAPNAFVARPWPVTAREELFRYALGDLADLNIVLIIMDSVSRLQFRRSMPVTQRLLESLNRGNVAEVFDMEMLNVVGWHSRQNQLPLLLGHDCQGESHADFYDHQKAEESGRFNCEHVIWPFFKARGYVTAQFGDQCNLERKKFPGNAVLELHCLDVLTEKCGLEEPLQDVKNPVLTECLGNERIQDPNTAGVVNSMLCINSTAVFNLSSRRSGITVTRVSPPWCLC